MFKGIISTKHIFLVGRSSTSTSWKFCLLIQNDYIKPQNVLSKACNRTFFSSRTNFLPTAPRLTQQEINSILEAAEYSQEFSIQGPVKSYDSNQLASNTPIEDTRAEAVCLLTKGLLFGVFDGHAGSACAHILSKRLFNYIAVHLLSTYSLKQYSAELEKSEQVRLIDSFNDKTVLVEDVAKIYRKSFKKLVERLEKQSETNTIEEAIENAYVRLDEDISNEAKLTSIDKQTKIKTLSVAMSGAVACVAHIDGPDLHVSHSGDVSAVLGVLNEADNWIPKKLTREHSIDNPVEVDRILSEHPNERSTVLKFDRLLGQLAPLRALGDFRYKWDVKTLRSYAVPNMGPNVIPPDYFTPPYLTGKPDVVHHRLSPRDKFLVIASDGLWEMLSPLQVVRLVGEHMFGKVTLTPLKLPRREVTLHEVSEMLHARKQTLTMKPNDKNAATHLLRNALGGTEYGIDNEKLSQLLSLPSDVSRMFRDDITITVIYFDSDFIRHCPL